MKDEFYSAESFEWTYRQVKWLLVWLPTIREANLDWPPAPKNSNYTDVAKPKRIDNLLKVWRKITHKANKPYRAKWENERSILGHLENRLCKAGLDGILIKAIYSYKEDATWLGKCLNLPYKVVLKRAIDALDRLVETEQDNIKEYKRRLKE